MVISHVLIQYIKVLSRCKASDVAELIVYNANLPKHVNLAESLILAGAQSRATKIHRQV